MNWPQNPYIAGMPIRAERDFFGRQEIIDWVGNELRVPGSNMLILHGQRRIGKTSVLLQLDRLLPRDDFLTVFFDLMDIANQPLNNVLVELAEEMVDKASMRSEVKSLPTLPRTVDDGRIFRQEFLFTTKDYSS